MPLLNASSASFPPPSHGSGSGWFATPFLHDSFIHYFTPVYPDANVAVGMPVARLVARHPPHRTVLALLTHTVPTLDNGVGRYPTRAPAPAMVGPLVRPGVRCGYRLVRVLLGRQPSLHDLLQPSQAFVRSLRWYYAAARLPVPVHLGLIALRLHPAVRVLLPTDGDGASRFSRVKFLCMPGVLDSAGCGALALAHTAWLSSG